MNCTKTCYSKREAQGTIKRIMNGRRRNRPKQLRAYLCPQCNAWHLTHKERNS